MCSLLIVFSCEVFFYNVGTKCSYIPPNTSISAMSKEELNSICNPFVKEEFVKKIVGDDKGKLSL